MDNKKYKNVREFLKENKQIDSSNVNQIDRFETSKVIYELRAYLDGKLAGISFGHTITGWIKQNGVIIPNSKAAQKPKESPVKTIWTNEQQKYLDDMKNEINQRFDKMDQKFNKIFKHLGIK